MNIKFDSKEENLIERSFEKYIEMNRINDLERNKKNIIKTVKAGHDRYVVVSDIEDHKTMNSILKKCGEIVESAEEKKAREEKEHSISRKEARRKIKEGIKKRKKEEAEQEIKQLGLIEEDKPKENLPEREDVTKIKTFTNIEETLKENTEKKEKVTIIDNPPPDVNYDDLQKNTIPKLKELADYLEVKYDPNILKDDLLKIVEKKVAE